MSWAPLRVHTDVSFLKAFGKPKAFVDKCKQFGYNACAITNIDNLFACVDFFKECKSNNIKPILGCEFKNGLIILCRNKIGWKQLMTAVSEMSENTDFVESNSSSHFGENHVAISGYYGSDIANTILGDGAYSAESIEHARSFLHSDWKSILNEYINCSSNYYNGNFYLAIELLDPKFYPSIVLAECFREVAKENTNCKLLASNDCRYINQEDADCHRVLLCSSGKMTLPESENRLRNKIVFEDMHYFLSNKYYLPSMEDLAKIYSSQELQSSIDIVDLCEEYDILSAPILPSFDCPNQISEIEYLKELCREGWRNKLNPEQKKSEDYIRRIRDEELPVIEDANLSGYFLIVQDIINYVKNRGWLPGPGRGSAAGCLISYLIGITQVDPVPFKLLFSRFYNASRKGSLPDIDIDVPAEHRDEIIAYIKEKYGEDRVSQMITFGRLQGRSAIKEVMRIEGTVSFAEMNEITKYIPDEARIADELEEMEDKSIIRWSLMNNAKDLEKWCVLHEDGSLSGELAETFKKAIKIEGTYKSRGKHAAGVIIAGESLKNLCPMVKDKDGNMIAAFEMADLEAIGLVKFDILGVDILSKVMKVAQDRNLDLNDFNDIKVWENTLCKGDTQGVFQLESQLGKSWAKRLKPRNLEELSALIAVIRPGCLESYINGKSLTWHYINRKNRVDPVEYFHPALEPILKDTYGILVYQEQSMMIATEIAGFTQQEADSLRKAIGKKLPELMAKLKKDFLEGCKKVGKVNEQEAAQIFDWIEASQRYSFNKSHSVCYAVNGYWSAYCKYYNQEKFYEVYLNHSKRKQDSQQEIKELVNDAKLHNIEVLPPSLTNFYLEFLKTGNDQIYFGLSHIKDVGETECKKLVAFSDIDKMTWMQVLTTFGETLNKRAFVALVSTGALNGPCNKVSRNQMLYEFDSWKTLSDREKEFIINNLNKNETLIYHVNKLINECKITSTRMKQVYGIYTCLKNPTSNLQDEISWIASIENKYFGTPLTFAKSDAIDTNIVNASCKDIYNNSVRGEARIAVHINSIREFKIKKGDNKGQTMAFLSVEDNSATLDSVVVFSEAFNDYKGVLYEGNTVIIIGKPSSKNDGSLIVNRVCQA